MWWWDVVVEGCGGGWGGKVGRGEGDLLESVSGKPGLGRPGETEGRHVLLLLLLVLLLLQVLLVLLLVHEHGLPHGRQSSAARAHRPRAGP